MGRKEDSTSCRTPCPWSPPMLSCSHQAAHGEMHTSPGLTWLPYTQPNVNHRPPPESVVYFNTKALICITSHQPSFTTISTTPNSQYYSFRTHRSKLSTCFIVNPILLSSFSSYRGTNQSPSNRNHPHFWPLQFQSSLCLHYHHTSWDWRFTYAEYQSLRWPFRPELTNATLKDYEP